MMLIFTRLQSANSTVRITAGWPVGRRPKQAAGAEPGAEADELTAELTASYWQAHDQRLAETSLFAIARQLPGLIGQAIRLGWEANRRDTVATIGLNLVSGILTGFALLATNSVLEALFEEGPTPDRVRAVLLVLLLLAELPGGWAAVRAARIGYITNFALADSHRRKWILTDLMAERHTAAEMRSFTLRHFMLARVGRLAAYARDAQMKAAGRQALTRVTAQAAGGVATAGVYAALGILLAVGALPLAAAGTAVLAIRSAQSSLNTLLYAVNQCYEEGLYFSDYLAFCADADRRIPAPGTRSVPADFDRITADAVTFTYPGSSQPALREVSIEIRRGEVVALVGSGKTTLAKILAGLYRPDSGTVRWDQTAIADVDQEPLREQIAVIAQDHANWPLTVRHNIAMGRDADPAALARAAQASDADTVIEKLPHGYDTLLDRHFKDGVELSGGQWQRIAAARGFYRSAPLLIMDEPTAALDARAEYALFSSIRGHARDRSVLLITHRLASVKHADRIYVLRDGQVIEQGVHADLLALGGQYAELFTLQAAQYNL